MIAPTTPEKIEQGRDPAPNDATLQFNMVTLRLETGWFSIETAAAFSPACPPKTWTAGRSGLRVASRLDLAPGTLSDLAAFVTEK
jgi:hypothetical protein